MSRPDIYFTLSHYASKEGGENKLEVDGPAALDSLCLDTPYGVCCTPNFIRTNSTGPGGEVQIDCNLHACIRKALWILFHRDAVITVGYPTLAGADLMLKW